ncbi:MULTISPECIES: glycoside hydrolase family 75 protein [Xanthobacter]|uniref:Glycoside hydrolase family 75 protein n=1 Tax=Xanthobacter aminoxidans TaxID=186280 RepID=A0ABW6ZQA0_9HYPH|nr:glycoside hydrolase family 75 protein [Xanthobacter sp. 91]
MRIELARIGGVSVIQDEDGRVHWEAGGAIDADGANGQNGAKFAYRMDDKGLDALKNAGWPSGSWDNVLFDRGDGHPLADDDGNVYSKTTYAWKGRAIPTRYVDAATVPYVVVNPLVRQRAVGIVMGCRALVTYKGKSVAAVVADVSGAARIGELSIAAAKALGIPSSPRKGGTDTGVTYEMWPGSAAIIDGAIYELQRA